MQTPRVDGTVRGFDDAHFQVAFGQVAFGQVAFGQVAFGQVAFGQVAFGQVAFGQVAFGPGQSSGKCGGFRGDVKISPSRRDCLRRRR
jgi:hypothetical protein